MADSVAVPLRHGVKTNHVLGVLIRDSFQGSKLASDDLFIRQQVSHLAVFNASGFVGDKIDFQVVQNPNRHRVPVGAKVLTNHVFKQFADVVGTISSHGVAHPQVREIAFLTDLEQPFPMNVVHRCHSHKTSFMQVIQILQNHFHRCLDTLRLEAFGDAVGGHQ